MTKDESIILHALESKVRRLIEEYKNLEQENQELYNMVSGMEQELTAAKAEVQSLKQDYVHLKTAKMLEVSTGDIDEAKRKVAALIREVDKCIDALNL